KRTVSPARSRISAAAYSVKRSGQPATSFVMSQTRSNGASMTMVFSVCPGTGGLRFGDATIGEVDGAANGLDVRRLVVGDWNAVLLLDGQLKLDDGQRVEPHLLERQGGIVAHHVLGDADAIDEDAFQILKQEPLGLHRPLLVEPFHS